ncbi:MAG: hypothetical protein WDN07_02965 [Actinomycetota bacterium]
MITSFDALRSDFEIRTTWAKSFKVAVLVDDWICRTPTVTTNHATTTSDMAPAINKEIFFK